MNENKTKEIKGGAIMKVDFSTRRRLKTNASKLGISMKEYTDRLSKLSTGQVAKLLEQDILKILKVTVNNYEKLRHKKTKNVQEKRLRT